MLRSCVADSYAVHEQQAKQVHEVRFGNRDIKSADQANQEKLPLSEEGFHACLQYLPKARRHQNMPRTFRD